MVRGEEAAPVAKGRLVGGLVRVVEVTPVAVPVPGHGEEDLRLGERGDRAPGPHHRPEPELRGRVGPSRFHMDSFRCG